MVLSSTKLKFYYQAMQKSDVTQSDVNKVGLDLLEM